MFRKFSKQMIHQTKKGTKNYYEGKHNVCEDID